MNEMVKVGMRGGYKLGVMALQSALDTLKIELCPDRISWKVQYEGKEYGDYYHINPSENRSDRLLSEDMTELVKQAVRCCMAVILEELERDE